MPLPGLRPLLSCLCGLLAVAAMAGPPESPVADSRDLQVTPPPFTEGIFPCTTCHDPKAMPPNPQKRVLEGMHADIELHHGDRWCTDCHSLNNRDKLHLVNGDLLDFTKSYVLCGQCHGDKLRDWKVGVHGKRTGSWNGTKQYWLCVGCHNPHSPRFKPLKPLPPPLPPEQIQLRK